jgi:hypothetical protein
VALALIVAARRMGRRLPACALFALPAMAVGVGRGEPARHREPAPPRDSEPCRVFQPLAEFPKREGRSSSSCSS